MKCSADNLGTRYREYKVGQKVWVETDNLDLNRPSKKLVKKQSDLMRSDEWSLSPPKPLPKTNTTIQTHSVLNYPGYAPTGTPDHCQETTIGHSCGAPHGELWIWSWQILDSTTCSGQLQYGHMQGSLRNPTPWAPWPIWPSTGRQSTHSTTHTSAPRKIRSRAHFNFWPYEILQGDPNGLTFSPGVEPKEGVVYERNFYFFY